MLVEETPQLGRIFIRHALLLLCSVPLTLGLVSIFYSFDALG